MNLNKNAGDIVISIRLMALSLLVLAGIYPMAVTLYANVFFSQKAKGSLIGEELDWMASKNISLDFGGKGLFLARPSASNFNTLPSGASNLSRTSQTLHDQVKERETQLIAIGIDPSACSELLYASASGIDPHITPACALDQAKVLSKQLGISMEKLMTLLKENSEPSIFGILGRERVNVVSLNMDLRKIMNVR